LYFLKTQPALFHKFHVQIKKITKKKKKKKMFK
jgi:hypothetical protein